MRTKYSDEQKAEALAILASHGKAEAARRTGIPAGTIASWGSRCGVASPDDPVAAKGVAAKAASVADRKAQLASDLLDDVQRLRAQLFAPVVERKAMTVSDGHNAGSHIEVADVDLNRPTAVDQKHMMTAIAIAVDKVQILTGEATERIEQLTAVTPTQIEEQALAVVHDLEAYRESA